MSKSEKLYKVRVIVHSIRVVEVFADSEVDAREKAQDDWDFGDEVESEYRGLEGVELVDQENDDD